RPRRRRLRLLHLLLGRDAALQEPHRRRRQADRRGNDPPRLDLRLRARPPRRRRRPHHHPRRLRDLVRPQLHRQGLRPGTGVMTIRTLALLLTLAPTRAEAQAKPGWGNVGKQQEAAGFSWTQPLFGGFWMAWTPATLAFFAFIFAAIALMGLLEWRNP